MEIVRIIGEGLLVALALLAFLLKRKGEKGLGDCIDADKLVSVIFEAMVSVEQKYKSLENTGVDCSGMKRDDVINIAKTTALTNGWNFNEQGVRELIERFVKFSKQVNAKK